MRQFEVWRGDEYLGIFLESELDELGQFEDDDWIRVIDISV